MRTDPGHAAMASAFLLLSGISALADDGASAPHWSGFSVALGGGTSKVENDYTFDGIRGVPAHPNFGNLTITGNVGASDSSDWDGFGSLQAGYDHVISGRFLVGAFVDFDFANDRSSDVSYVENNPTLAFTAGNPTFASSIALAGTVETEKVWTVGGRIGAIIQPHLLVYGLAGYSEMDISGQFTAFYQDQFNNNVQLPTVRLSDRWSGYTVGGGGEYAFHENMTLRLEYRYAKFDGDSLSANQQYAAFGVQNSDTINASVDDIEMHSVRGMLVFKLGH